MKDEVLGFFREFFEHNKFIKSLNATFLVLVPKGRTVEDLKDLRPINLVGSLYKILSKVLANKQNQKSYEVDYFLVSKCVCRKEANS